jgi:hypothetical protein
MKSLVIPFKIGPNTIKVRQYHLWDQSIWHNKYIMDIKDVVVINSVITTTLMIKII